jgi:hypothetical protein
VRSRGVHSAGGDNGCLWIEKSLAPAAQLGNRLLAASVPRHVQPAAAGTPLPYLLHLSHDVVKPHRPLSALRAIGVGRIQVPQFDLTQTTGRRNNKASQQPAVQAARYSRRRVTHLSLRQFVFADDHEQRHAALERLDKR